MADLVMSGISKSFGGVKALTDANLELMRGEVHALLGENGAGKSTMIKVLSGSVKSDAGQILLDGLNLRIASPSDSIKNKIGIVYQELSLIPDLTVAENIFYGQSTDNRFGVISLDTLVKKTRTLMASLNISAIDPRAVVRELPLTERQLIEIVKVLSRKPEVIIFDEATSSLTRDYVGWLLQLCKDLASQGKMVVFISHRMDEIKQITDRVTVFRSGQNVGVRKMNETNTDELVTLMLGRRVARLFPEKTDTVKEKVILETKSLQLGNSLKDVNLKLRQGEILGIGGLAGQGQAALFLSLFGVYRPSGEIWVEGKKVRIRSPRDCFNKGIGMALVPEDRGNQGLVLAKSIKHNISLSILSRLSRFGLINRRKENEAVHSMFGLLQIAASSPDQPVRELSGGNQQKVVFAKLLLTQPRILMLFDCTRGVDVGTKSEIFSMIRKMAAEGKSIIMYSTDVEELVHVCDRVLVMNGGKIAAELTGPIMNNENIIRASVGEEVAK